jgi:hypothetical protein
MMMGARAQSGRKSPMAGKKKIAPEEVQLGLTKTVERHKTIRLGVIVGGIVVGLSSVAWAVAWAVVRVNEKAPWVELGLAILAPNGIIAVWLGTRWRRVNRRLKKLEDALKSKVESTFIPPANE